MRYQRPPTQQAQSADNHLNRKRGYRKSNMALSAIFSSMLLASSVLLTSSVVLVACAESPPEASTTNTSTNEPENQTVASSQTGATDNNIASADVVSSPVDAVALTDVASTKEGAVSPAGGGSTVAGANSISSNDVPIDATAIGVPSSDSVETGMQLYEQRCQICHASGLLNAPKLGDSVAWAPRIAKGRPMLYKHSSEGFEKMPPQAVEGISVEQVQAAVDYMVAQAQ